MIFFGIKLTSKKSSTPWRGHLYKNTFFFNFALWSVIKPWFQVVYRDVTSDVTHCGYLWLFSIERNCRQGGPLFCYIRILFTELLSHVLRHKANIKGYTINGMEDKFLYMQMVLLSFCIDQSLTKTLTVFYNISD